MNLATRADLAALLDRPVPVAQLTGALARAPERTVFVGPCSLSQVMAWTLSSSALRWVAGRVELDVAAVAKARLAAVIWADAQGTPLFAADRLAWLERLPAGLVDRLLYASDRAGGYQPAAPASTTADLAAYGGSGAQRLTGLLPQAPEAALWVHPYDFATLAAAEAAATMAVPGGEVRVEVAAWPLLLAEVVRGGEAADAPRLLDAELARRLPYGAARAIIEIADLLSEMGGPDPGLRFPDHPARATVDGVGALAAAPDGSLPQ